MNSPGTEVRSDRNVQISVVSHATFFLPWKWEVQIQSQVGIVGQEVRSVQLFESQVVIISAVIMMMGQRLRFFLLWASNKTLSYPEDCSQHSQASNCVQVIYDFAFHCVQGGMAANMWI